MVLLVGGNITSAVTGLYFFPLFHRFLIHDGDPVFTEQFATLPRSAGVEPVKLPLRSPILPWNTRWPPVILMMPQ